MGVDGLPAWSWEHFLSRVLGHALTFGPQVGQVIPDLICGLAACGHVFEGVSAG